MPFHPSAQSSPSFYFLPTHSLQVTKEFLTQSPRFTLCSQKQTEAHFLTLLCLAPIVAHYKYSFLLCFFFPPLNHISSKSFPIGLHISSGFFSTNVQDSQVLIQSFTTLSHTPSHQHLRCIYYSTSTATKNRVHVYFQVVGGINSGWVLRRNNGLKVNTFQVRLGTL